MRPAAAQKVEVKPEAGEDIHFDFRDAPILDIIDVLFRAKPGANKIVKPGVLGKVSITLNNLEWETVLKYVVEQVKARVRKDENGVYIVEPDSRFQRPPQGGTPEMPGMPGLSGLPGTMGEGRGRRRGGAEGGFPGLPGMRGQEPGGIDEGVTTDEKRYHLVSVRHVYAGGMARLVNGSIVSTDIFLLPSTASMSGCGGLGGFGGFGGLGGGFGGFR
jgi:hypothetical protein